MMQCYQSDAGMEVYYFLAKEGDPLLNFKNLSRADTRKSARLHISVK